VTGAAASPAGTGPLPGPWPGPWPGSLAGAHPGAAADLMTTAEVAAMFRVGSTTVLRWADTGHLSSLRTLGGHRRFRTAEVRALATASRKW
jgi:excisionase family DNA binding protein